MSTVKVETQEDSLSNDNSCFLCLQTTFLNVNSGVINSANSFFKYLKIRDEIGAFACEKCGEILIKFVNLCQALEKTRLEMDYLLESMKSAILFSENTKPVHSRVASVRKMVVVKCSEKLGNNRQPQIILQRIDTPRFKNERSPIPASDLSDDYWDSDIVSELSSSDDESDITTPVINEKTAKKASEGDAKITHKAKRLKRRVQCKICLKTFCSNNALGRHTDQVHLRLKRFKCPTCSKSFGQTGALNTHIRSIHLRLQTYKCDICDKTFARADSFKRHKATPHKPKPDISNSKRFPCEICEKAFGNLKSVNRHKHDVHSEIKFPCSICDKVFRKQIRLQRHFSSVHEKLRVYCVVEGCTKSYSEQSGLLIHYKLKHPEFKVPSKDSECNKGYLKKLVDGKNVFECKICNSKLKTARFARIHVRTVHGSKKFLCEDCGFRTTLGKTLKVHIERKHKIAKFVECEVCKKTINCLDIKKHMRVVHGLKKFKCQECDYSATERRRLDNHCKTMHGQNEEPKNAKSGANNDN